MFVQWFVSESFQNLCSGSWAHLVTDTHVWLWVIKSTKTQHTQQTTSFEHPFRWQRWNHSVGKPLQQNFMEDVKIAVSSVNWQFTTLKKKKSVCDEAGTNVLVVQLCVSSLPGWWPGTPRVWGRGPSSQEWAPPGPCLWTEGRPASVEWSARRPEPAASSERSAPSAPPAEVWGTLSNAQEEPTFVLRVGFNALAWCEFQNCEECFTLSGTGTVPCTVFTWSSIFLLFLPGHSRTVVLRV